MKFWSMVNANAFLGINTTVLAFAFRTVYKIKFSFFRYANVSQDTSEIHLAYVLEPAHQTKLSSTEYVNATLGM